MRLWTGCALGALLAISGCDYAVTGHADQDFHYSYAFQPGGSLDVENTNGSVTISGWDRDSIDVSGTKYAPSDERLEDVRINVKVEGNTASVKTEAPSSWAGGYGARYSIHVPRRVAIRLGHTVNGSISAEDLDGGGRLESTNGRISLERDQGDYNVETTNGSVEVTECSGKDRLQTVNGSVHAQLKGGAVNAKSTNGTVDVSISNAANGEPIRLTGMNGSISFALAALGDNPMDLETTNGSITLRLPSNANAQIAAHTLTGSVSAELPLSSTEEASKHTLRGQLGKGGPLISASTTTGGIRIERY